VADGCIGGVRGELALPSQYGNGIVEPVEECDGQTICSPECYLGFQYVPEGTTDKPFEMCVGTAVLGARARHPVIRQMLEEIPRGIAGPAAFEILGPQMSTSVLIRAGLTGYSQTAVQIGGATIFPKEAFYPHFYKEQLDRSTVGPATYSIHHWAKRW
jgi:hypothetical protein